MARPPDARAAGALYRAILRAHRTRLPPPMRVMGDAYARDEFRRLAAAQSVTGPQWDEFFGQWHKYVDQLTGRASLADTSGHLTSGDLERLSPEQKAQLARLREAAAALGGGKG